MESLHDSAGEPSAPESIAPMVAPARPFVPIAPPPAETAVAPTLAVPPEPPPVLPPVVPAFGSSAFGTAPPAIAVPAAVEPPLLPALPAAPPLPAVASAPEPTTVAPPPPLVSPLAPLPISPPVFFEPPPTLVLPASSEEASSSAASAPPDFDPSPEASEFSAKVAEDPPVPAFRFEPIAPLVPDPIAPVAEVPSEPPPVPTRRCGIGERAMDTAVFEPSAEAAPEPGAWMAPTAPVLEPARPAAVSSWEAPPSEPPQPCASQSDVPPMGFAPAPVAGPAGAVEDLSFGYVDDPTQLALRAIFSTDQTLRPQDVVDLSSRIRRGFGRA